MTEAYIIVSRKTKVIGNYSIGETDGPIVLDCIPRPEVIVLHSPESSGVLTVSTKSSSDIFKRGQKDSIEIDEYTIAVDHP